VIVVKPVRARHGERIFALYLHGVVGCHVRTGLHGKRDSRILRASWVKADEWTDSDRRWPSWFCAVSASQKAAARVYLAGFFHPAGAFGGLELGS